MNASAGRAGAWPRIVAVYGLLAAIFVARLLIDEPGLGLPYLAVFPIVLACFLLGRTHALACATLGLVIFLAPSGWRRSATWPKPLLIGTIGRAAVFYGLALWSATCSRARQAARGAGREREREVRELESLRAALTPRELPELEGSPSRPRTRRPRAWRGRLPPVTRAPRDRARGARRRRRPWPAAARRAAFVRTTIALFAEYAEDPMTILRLANTALAERDPGTEYVTALCAIIDPSARTMTWATRRAPAAVGPRSRRAAHRGAPVPAAGRRAASSRCGDHAPTARRRVLLFTDGLPEARTARASRATRSSARRPRRAPCATCVARHRRTSSPSSARPPCATPGARPPTTSVWWPCAWGRPRSAAGRVGGEAPGARDRREARIRDVGRGARAGGEAEALELLVPSTKIATPRARRRALRAPTRAAGTSSSQRVSGTSR